MGPATILARLRDRWRRHHVGSLPFARRGRGSMLFNGSVFAHPERIAIGDEVYIGPEAYFHGDGGITIGNNTIFGPRVAIFSSNHLIEGADALPFGVKSELRAVTIGANVYVGAGCMILPGVTIGEGAVCAAGAVIPKNVPPLAWVAGNPARIIRWRDPKEYARLKTSARPFLELLRDAGMRHDYITHPPKTEPLAETEEAARQREAFGMQE